VCNAIIETVFADLIDGPLAHMPSGRSGANSAWILCAAISHNLLRAAGVLAGDSYAVVRGATLRRHRQPSRTAGPPPTPIRTAPTQLLALGLGVENTMAQHYRHRTPPEAATYNRPRLTTAHRGPTQGNRKAGQTSGQLLATIRIKIKTASPHTTRVYRRIDPKYCRAESGDDLQWRTTAIAPPKGSDDSDSGTRPMR
jgi:hypothetical protein